MKGIALLILIFTCFKSYCQVKPVNFTECKYDQFFVSGDREPKWKIDSLDIPSYLNNYLKDKNLDSTASGTIVLGILIFEDGRPCCHHFANLTGKALDPEIFKQAVNNMPNWSPGLVKDNPVVFLKMLTLRLNKGIFTKSVGDR